MTSQIRCRPKGFTLLELLTVVLIVGVLVAVALMVGTRMYGNALDARCIGNLRTIGSALQSYIADHNGVLPPMSAMEDPFDPSNKEVLTAQKILMPYTGVDTSVAMPTEDNAGAAYGPWICPADRQARGKAKPNSPRWKGFSSYFVNSYVGKGVVDSAGNPADAKTVLRGVQVTRPNSIWYLADGYRSDGGQGRMTANMVSAAEASNTGDGLRFRHQGKIHVLMVSGTVQAFTPEQTQGKGNEFLIPTL